MNSSSTIEWRRNRVLELASQGYNQSEISRILQISHPTINRDTMYLRQQAKENIKKYIDERLPCSGSMYHVDKLVEFGLITHHIA